MIEKSDYVIFKSILDNTRGNDKLFNFKGKEIDQALDDIHEGLSAKVIRTYRASTIIN